jgi:hypothetical protein
MRRRIVMMNPIGIRNEDRIGSRGPWFGDCTATSVLEQGGAGPGGARVRRSGWVGRRSATGGSCGRRARAGSGWTSPSAMTGGTPNATRAAAPGSPSDPGSAPLPGSAPGLGVAGLRRCPGRGLAKQAFLLEGSEVAPLRSTGAGRPRRGTACISCPSRRGRVGCGRPSCRPRVGVGWRRRVPRLR